MALNPVGSLVPSLSNETMGTSAPVASVIRAVTVTDAVPPLVSTVCGVKSNATTTGGGVAGSVVAFATGPLGDNWAIPAAITREASRPARTRQEDMIPILRRRGRVCEEPKRRNVGALLAGRGR